MIRPRRLAHRGAVIATGFVIDASLVGATEARRRVLALWTAGAQVRLHHDQFVITGLRPNRVRTSAAPGAPLVGHDGVLAAMPLDPDELGELPATGTVVIARSGVAELVPLHGTPEVDIASWIDLDEFQILQPKPLATPPARAQLPVAPSTDVRAVTGAPPAAAAVNTVVAALRGARTSDAVTAGTPSAWQRLTHWLGNVLAPQKALPAESGTEPAKPSALDRLRSRLAEALWRSRLGAVLGRRHAAYLRRVLDLFDRGDLDEALRHAVPLGGDGDGDVSFGLGVPRPRQNLHLTFGARRARTVIPATDMALMLMHERYRAAAKRLEQAGRIEEAAFVLADLLADIQGAIALLERHGRHELAARLGEARNVDPGLIVRLWFLAGDRRRAIDVARKHQAWAHAVALLERSGDKQADVLRMLWADHLADTGDFVRAVEAAWPVASSRALVEAWIDRGLASEGSAAARLLVKKLVVSSSSFRDVTPAMLNVLAAPEEEGTRQRIAMIEELVASPPSPELRTIARPALRALLRDCARGAAGTTSELVDRLTTFADDAALRADRPVIAAAPMPPSLHDRTSPLELRWSAHDAGAIPVCDAALLPGNRLLLALGELGVRVVGRTGRTLAHIDQPATRLVVADNGARAIAIAPRGFVHRLARLDLVALRGAHWCDADLEAHATTFDGDLWLTTQGREVLAIDTTASRWRAVWGVAVDPASARCLVERDGRWFVIAVHDGAALEHWFYEDFTLRARKPRQRTGSEHVAVRPASPEAPPFVVREPDEESAAESPTVSLWRNLAVVGRQTTTGFAIEVSHVVTSKPLANLVLEGATTAGIRRSEALLTISDDRGRVIVFDLQSGVIRRELRTA
jgi:hypothetical protein